MSGPAGQSHAQRFLKGNPGRRPLKSAPTPKKGLPACPRHLGAVARAFWNRKGKELLAMGVMSPFFREQLELAAEAYADGRRARAILAEHGETYDSYSYPDGTKPDGSPLDPVVTMVRARPQIAMRNDADRRLASALAQLGASPASIARLASAGNAPEKDPLMDE